MPFPRPAAPSPVTALPALVALLLAGLLPALTPPRALAQVPGVTPPPLPGPGPIQAAGPRPFAGGVPDTVRLQFANSDVTDVLDNYYGPLTGKRIIYDSTLQGKLTVFINTPVPKDEAIRILENNLMLNGFAIVPGEGNFVRIINAASKNPRFYGPPIFSDPSQIPDGNQVISYLIKPRYADIQELQAVLTQYIQIQKQYTNFLALPKAGAILATEESTVIRRLVGLVEQLDLPPATVVDRFIKLERADAAKAVEFVNAVLGREKTGQVAGAQAGGAGGVPNARRPIRRINEDGQPVIDPAQPFTGIPSSPGLLGAVTALSEGALTAGSVNLQADVRTNRVHVVARPIDFPFIERLIVEFDANTPFANPVRRALRFVTATDMLPILVQSLAEQGTPDSGGQGGTNPANPNGTARNTNRTSSGSGGLSGNFGGSGSGGSSGSGSLFGSGSGGDSSGTSTGGLGSSTLQTSEVSDTPQAAVVGTTRLLADPRTNSISILGGAEARDKVTRILDLLDVPTPQVMIEVLIGELTLDNRREFGIDYLLRTSRNFQLTTNNGNFPLPGTTTGTTPTTPGTGTGTTQTAIGSISNLAQIATQSLAGFGGVSGAIAIGNSFGLAVRALESTQRFKTISRPLIFTSNNKAATILSGQEIAVPTGTVSSIAGNGTTTGALTSNIQYRRVALQLDVVPLINSANAVTLDIVQQVNNVVPGSSTNVGGSTVPTISTRALKTVVTVPNKGTVVLGGLITQSAQSDSGRVPLLHRVPLVGELFKSRVKDDARNELIILMRPVITNTAAQLFQNRVDEENNLYLEPGLKEQLRPIPKAKPVTAETTTTTTVRRRTEATTIYAK